MRGLIWVVVLAMSWLSLGACFYVHDDDCVSDADCHSGRVCQQGQCLDAEDAENSNGGFGGGGGTESTPSEETSSEETSSENTTSQPTSEPPDDDGPSCSGINSGTQIATVTDGPSICEASSSSVTAVFGDDSLLESLDGSACTLTDIGFECGESLADTYECGGCPFKVYLSELYYEGEWVTVGWAVTPTSCTNEACAEYCCTSDTGTNFNSLYWLPQTPPGATTSSSTSSTSSSTSATTGACTGPCCECGFPFCDGNCAGCC